MISPIKTTVDIRWFDVNLFVANDLEPSWLGTSNVTPWQHPKGSHSWCLLLLKAGDVVSPWVTDPWAKYSAMLSKSWFSAGCLTTESTELCRADLLCGPQPHLPWMTGRHRSHQILTGFLIHALTFFLRYLWPTDAYLYSQSCEIHRLGPNGFISINWFPYMNCNSVKSLKLLHVASSIFVFEYISFTYWLRWQLLVGFFLSLSLHLFGNIFMHIGLSGKTMDTFGNGKTSRLYVSLWWLLYGKPHLILSVMYRLA